MMAGRQIPEFAQTCGVADLSGMEHARSELKCSLCGLRGGAICACMTGGCGAAFHVPCARQAGHYELWASNVLVCGAHTDAILALPELRLGITVDDARALCAKLAT
jgi:hypothetical protein